MVQPSSSLYGQGATFAPNRRRSAVVLFAFLPLPTPNATSFTSFSLPHCRSHPRAMMTELQHPDHDGANASSAAITPTQRLRDQLSAFRFNEDLTPSLRRSPRNHGQFVKFEEEDSSLPALASDSAPPASKKRARSTLTPAVDDAPPRGSTRPKKQRSESIPAKKRKERPSVAPPEKYAHLNVLTDHLGEGPDILNGEHNSVLRIRTSLMNGRINPLKSCSVASSKYTSLRGPSQRTLTSPKSRPDVGHPRTSFCSSDESLLEVPPCIPYGVTSLKLSTGLLTFLFFLAELTDRLLNPREDHTLPADYNIGLVRF